MPTITFEPSGACIAVEEGTSILVAAVEAEETGVICCGITPACGLCAVDVLAGEESLSAPGELEQGYRLRHRFLPFRRLGCMAHVTGDIQVEVAR